VPQVTRRWAIGRGSGLRVGMLSSVGLVVMVAASGRAAAQMAPAAPESLGVGDWQLTPKAELRLRGEYWHDLDGQDDGVGLERARLGLDVERGPLEMRLVLQDARAFTLSTAAPFAGGGTVSVTGAYEAWIEAHTDGLRPSFVRAGRQPITWGEGRLLGESDWSPAGRSLDAVRGRLVVHDASFELLAAALSFPEDGLALDTYGELLGARAEWAFDPLFAAEAYVLVRVAQETPPGSLPVKGETYTGALRLYGDSRGWTWGAEGAYQLGRVVQLAANRGAWAAAGHVAYAFEGAVLRPAVQIGLSYATGDSGGATYRQFDPLLPDVHRWHGAMDLFAWSNEAEINGRVSIAPATDVQAWVEYRYARLAQRGAPWETAYLTTIGTSGGNHYVALGHEVDAALRWSPWDPLALEVGYSILFLGEGAEDILAANGIGRIDSPAAGVSPGELAHFAYAQATVRLP
jgi:hypothetical protein